MSILRKAAIAGAGVFALIACVPASGEGETESAQVAQVAPTPVATQVATPTPTPTPTGPSQFVFTGELEQGGGIRGQVPGGTVSAKLGDQELAMDGNGNFFAGFDRDQVPAAQLTAQLADGRTITKQLTIAPRNWNIEHINAARRAGGSSASFMRRRQPELDQIWDARTANSQSNGWSEGFIWPATGRISGRFGSQRVYRGEPGSYHSGLDIAGGRGTSIVAPAGGVVTLATSSPFSLEGNLLIIDHGQGLNSAFLHLSRIDVQEGDVVTQGQVLGAIGSSGRATGPHLHWSIKWHLSRLDPLLFLPPMP